MLRLLRWILTGWWNPPPSLRTLQKRVDSLEDRADYMQQQIRRVRGHLTGGIRYDEADGDEPDDDVAGRAGFPEDRFQQLLEERKRAHGTG